MSRRLGSLWTGDVPVGEGRSTRAGGGHITVAERDARQSSLGVPQHIVTKVEPHEDTSLFTRHHFTQGSSLPFVVAQQQRHGRL